MSKKQNKPKLGYALTKSDMKLVKLLTRKEISLQKSKACQDKYSNFTYILCELTKCSLFSGDDGLDVNRLLCLIPVESFNDLNNPVHGALLATIHLFGLFHYLLRLSLDLVRRKFGSVINPGSLESHCKIVAVQLTDKLLALYSDNTLSDQLKNYIFNVLQSSFLCAAQKESLYEDYFNIVLATSHRWDLMSEATLNSMGGGIKSPIDLEEGELLPEYLAKLFLPFMMAFGGRLPLSIPVLRSAFIQVVFEKTYSHSLGLGSDNVVPLVGFSILPYMCLSIAVLFNVLFTILAAISFQPSAEVYFMRLILLTIFVLGSTFLLARYFVNTTVDFITSIVFPLVAITLFAFFQGCKDSDWRWIQLCVSTILFSLPFKFTPISCTPGWISMSLNALTQRFSVYGTPISSIGWVATIVTIVFLSLVAVNILHRLSVMIKNGRLSNIKAMAQCRDKFLAYLCDMTFVPHYTYTPSQGKQQDDLLIKDGVTATRVWFIGSEKKADSETRQPRQKVKTRPKKPVLENKDPEETHPETSYNLPEGYYWLANNKYGILTFAPLNEFKRIGKRASTGDDLEGFIKKAREGRLSIFPRGNGMGKRNASAPNLPFKVRENRTTRKETRLLACLVGVMELPDRQCQVYQAQALVSGSH